MNKRYLTHWLTRIILLLVGLTIAHLGGTLGLGTVVCACLVGPTAQIVMPFSEKLCNRFLDKAPL